MNEPDAGRLEQAVQIAGRLAEAGVTAVRVRRGGQWAEYRARETDLPRVLCDLVPGDELRSGSILITATATGFDVAGF